MLLAPRLLLTALHCVDGVQVGDSECRLQVSVADRAPVPAVLEAKAETSDLALLKLSHSLGSAVRIPVASRCQRGDKWFAPSRPSRADPELAGEVVGPLLYDCQAGGVIDAVELTTQTMIGNYQGYSGGPVFTVPEEQHSVIGVLIEQYPDRLDEMRASNTLFAAAIEGAMDQFESLQTAYLLRKVQDSQEAHDKAAAKRDEGYKRTLDRVDTMLDFEDADQRHVSTVLGFLGAAGAIDPEVRGLHQAMVNKWVLEHSERDDGRADAR
ncbi:serine protease [Amycolatopsis sp. NPDC051758]|uniref:serine protease n=1 Tax=Amycolatopsis sp. NPDC051758 TaxID=3363935 RepID=UPI003794A961